MEPIRNMRDAEKALADFDEHLRKAMEDFDIDAAFLMRRLRELIEEEFGPGEEVVG